MSAAPVNLAEVRAAPDPVVVEVLEDLLEQAKAGEVIGFAIALAYRGRATGTGYSTGSSGDVAIADLVCSIERVKLLLLALGEE